MVQTITRREVVAGGLVGLGAAVAGPYADAAAHEGNGRLRGRPNVLLVYLDDLGYGDLSSYGSASISTPNIDRLAQRGTRFTQGYSGAPVCTPSRAALLTGRVPARSGLVDVLYPEDSGGLPAEERTVASYLQDAGYATTAIGKWHLGRLEDYPPDEYGFDHFFGINAVFSANRYPIEVRSGRQVVGTIHDDSDLALLTGRLTDEAIAAIDRAADRPFFIYLAETTPHIPVVVEPGFEGRSAAGPYGDMVEALDHHLGRLFRALEERDLVEDTLVLLISDNGPDKGSSGPLRGGKWEAYEGGMGVPFIAHRPGTVRSGRVSDDVVSVTDVLPTLCTLAGIRPDQDVDLDGVDITPTLVGSRARRPDRPIWYYLGARVAAVRDGDWKLVVARRGTDQAGLPELYNLSADRAETTNLAAAEPDKVGRLQDLIDQHEAEVRGEGTTGPLRLGTVSAESPALAGRPLVVKVPVQHVEERHSRHNGKGRQVQVEVTIDVPSGWESAPVTVAVAQGETVVAEVLVTPAVPRSYVGRLLEHRLTATATSGRGPVTGNPHVAVVVVPAPQEGLLALDAGTATSPLFDGYTRLWAAAKWDPAVGFGWVGGSPTARDRHAPDPLRQDMITSQNPATLRLAVPAGGHTVWFLRGDDGFATTGFVVDVDGRRALSTGPSVGAGEYYWERVAVDGGESGRPVDLTFSNDQGLYWKLLALVVDV